MPTLKGTEASLSCVQFFLSLVSSSVKVSFDILHVCIPSGQTSIQLGFGGFFCTKVPELSYKQFGGRSTCTMYINHPE